MIRDICILRGGNVSFEGEEDGDHPLTYSETLRLRPREFSGLREPMRQNNNLRSR